MADKIRLRELSAHDKLVYKKFNTPDKRLMAMAQNLRKITRLLDGDKKLVAETLAEIAEVLTTEAVIFRANKNWFEKAIEDGRKGAKTR